MADPKEALERLKEDALERLKKNARERIAKVIELEEAGVCSRDTLDIARNDRDRALIALGRKALSAGKEAGNGDNPSNSRIGTVIEDAHRRRVDREAFIAEREGLEREVAEWRQVAEVEAAERRRAHAKLSALSAGLQDLSDLFNYDGELSCSGDHQLAVVMRTRALLHPTVPVETNPSDEERAAARRFLHQTLGPKAPPSQGMETRETNDNSKILAGLSEAVDGDFTIKTVPRPRLFEAFIADEEEGPVTGILVELPDGQQIWSGECSDQTFNEQAEEVRDELGFNSGTLVLRGMPDKSIQVVCKAADVEIGIEIVRALGRQALAALQSHKGGEGDSELAAADNNHKADCTTSGGAG